MFEDRPEDRYESHTPGVVPDWVEGARITGREATAYREIKEGQGSEINNMLAREIHKETTLRARLTEMGIERERVERVYVEARPGDRDVAIIPWDIVFDLFNRENGVVGKMGVVG